MENKVQPNNLKVPFELPLKEAMLVYKSRLYLFGETLLFSSVVCICAIIGIYTKIFFVWLLILAVIVAYRKHWYYFDHKPKICMVKDEDIDNKLHADLIKALNHMEHKNNLKIFTEKYLNSQEQNSVMQEKIKEVMMTGNSQKQLSSTHSGNNRVKASTEGIW